MTDMIDFIDDLDRYTRTPAAKPCLCGSIFEENGCDWHMNKPSECPHIGSDVHDAPIIGENVDPLKWDAIITTGLQAVEQLDIGRWVVGELGLMVQKSYGDDEFGQFADEIKIERKRASEYRAMARYYPKEARDSRCNYSLHRVAMRLNDLDASMEILDKAAENNWTVMDLTEAVMLAKGETVKPSPITFTAIFYKAADGRVTVEGLDGTLIKPGVVYVMTAKEAGL